MGLDKLNPFKKSSTPKITETKAEESTTEPFRSRGQLSADDNLAPTKSTSSIANSIRSIGSKAENFLQSEPPHETFSRDGKVDASRIPQTLSTGNIGNGLSPSPSSGLM